MSWTGTNYALPSAPVLASPRWTDTPTYCASGTSAELLARNGIVALVAVIAPHRASRAAVRSHHQQNGTGFCEIYVDTPLDVCVGRDVKGLYAKQRAGLLSGLTGVDDPYERPEQPDLVITTVGSSIDECAAPILEMAIPTGVRRASI